MTWTGLVTNVDEDALARIGTDNELLRPWREKTGNPYLTLTVAKSLVRIERRNRHLVGNR